MAKYRKVDSRIWNDEKFRSLSDSAKLVFFMLLTHPHMTSIGAMRHTIPGMASEMGWTAKAFSEAFAEALSKGMAKHDEAACFVWLPKFITYNQPENPNVLKGWESALDLLPECALKNELIHAVKDFAEGLTEAFHKALPEAFRKGMPKQEQEQEQEIKGPQPPLPQNPKFVLPDWIPEDAWNAYLEMRKKAKKAPTDRAKELVVKELAKLRDAGENVAAVLDQSTMRVWTDVYAVKNKGAAVTPQAPVRTV